MKLIEIAALALCLICCSCGRATADGKTAEATAQRPTGREFDADSAYAYVKAQVDFGPRVPGTEGHRRCGDYLEAKLREFGADTVTVQQGKVTTFKGDEIPFRNILARYNGAASRRVLLLAHWDTRPWADQETSLADRSKPIPGANDGGSGVGVLLEVARQLGKERPQVGVDILLVDAEDSGQSDGWDNNEETWCLGTQRWAASDPYKGMTAPAYGVLLDMVGARDAVFYREYLSDRHAKAVVDKLWSLAAKSGLGERFVNELGSGVTDDHLYVNRMGIPCVDIIECLHPVTRSFNPTWHTLADNMDVIDPATLDAVGQLVVELVYGEKDGE